MIPGECSHYQTTDGPRVPLRWGSAPTEVCKLCGCWRTMHHKPGPWLNPPISTERDDET